MNQRNPQSNVSAGAHRGRRVSGVLAVLAAAGLGLHTARAVADPHVILQPRAGGIAATPDVTSFVTSNTTATLGWNGFAGPYQVYRRSSLTAPWVPVGTAVDLKSLTLPRDEGTAFYRIEGAPPPYTGAETCIDCHGTSHAGWSLSKHANAMETLRQIGQQNNAACVVCHSVGAGTGAGYINYTNAQSQYFMGVQCENCHGPAGNHASNPGDKALRPVVTTSAMLCGGCHNGFHHPTFDEWSTAGHSAVTPAVANYFRDPNPTNSVARMNSCGACHSGAVRLAMLEGFEKSKPVVLPTGAEAASTPITCSVCHTAHASTPHGSQLRNPTHSLAPFSYSTGTNTSFALQYNPDVNLCGQCHNMRGARWQDTSRYPHYSPQYNMLIGSGGVEVGTPEQSKHRDSLKQCAQCHTHRHDPPVPTEENPVFTGHGFEPSLQACSECHTTTPPDQLLAATQAATEARIHEIKLLLDEWATTKAPEALRTKYGVLAWEYNTPGHISNPTGSSSIKGPTSAEQTAVPDDIKQARFNLYLVDQDGSKGIHNAKYAAYLMKVAEDKVKALLVP